MINRTLFLLLLLSMSNSLKAQKWDNKLNYSLLEVAADGNVDSLISILKLDPKIDFRDVNNGTALFYATQNNHIDIVKILVFNGANPNYGTDDGFTPLMTACYNGYFDMAEYLAHAGASIDMRDEYWATAIHYAVAMNNYYIVDMLLYYGANAHLLTYEKNSTLLIASLNGDTAITRLLLEKDVDIDTENKMGYSPLSVAVQNNDSLMFDFLMEHGAKKEVLKKKRYNPSAWALLNNNIYAYQKLKPEQAHMQTEENNRYNPLNIAYSKGEKELINKLKNEGLNSGYLPYYDAVKFQYTASINGSDVFSNLGLGFQDAKYKTDLILSYGTRFRQKAVLFQESSDSYLQLWEHRRYFELYLQKRFELKAEPIGIQFYGGLGAQFMFGKYDGVKQKISPSFVLVPQIGFQINLNPIYFLIGYEYTYYKLYDISEHKMKIGIGLRLNLVKKPSKYNLLWI